MKNVVVSDAKPLKTYAIIGYANNKERFEDETEGPSNKLEAVYAKSEFEVSLSFKELEPRSNFGISEVIEACNEHYFPNFRTMFSKDDNTCNYFPEKFYDEYLGFKALDENQFLIRVGKHSGARAVTIDGMREIKVKESGGGPKRKPNKWITTEEETTTWMFGQTERDNKNLLPFGWVLCEVLE